MDNMIRMPYPPTGDGGIIRKIIKVVKTIFDIFKKPSKEAGSTDSINDNSSLDNIDRITEIFVDFKEQISSKATEIENSVEAEIRYYSEELHDILNEHSDMVDAYGIRFIRIEKQIDKLAAKVKGSIENEISKKVSLDNAQCREIVKMIPGAKKEQAMHTFLTNTVKSALEICCSDMRDILSDIYNEVEESVIGAVDAIQKKNKDILDKISAIDTENYADTAKKQIIDAYYMIDVCKSVEQVLWME